jgi:hypothetical protein
MIRQQKTLLVLLGALIGLTGCAAAPIPPVPAKPDLASALKAAAGADTAIITVSHETPCCPKQTLPQFLGITGAVKGICALTTRLRNRLGMAFPGLEATPPLLAITDPANMSEDSPPAVKAAADIKTQEDAAAQKIKALRYLATIGCGGCYPDVEEALIAAMDDCTEEVRYEAVLAVRKTTGVCCVYCSCDACCTEKIQNKLRELANGQNSPCCGGETSARVRRQARMALAECGPPVVVAKPEAAKPVTEGPKEGPSEGPDTTEPGEGPATDAVEASDKVTQAQRAVDNQSALVAEGHAPPMSQLGTATLVPLPPVM